MTGDDPQGTMERVSPFRLPLRAHFHREREMSGYEAGTHPCLYDTRIRR